MGRCEGYYRLENRRCDRTGSRKVAAADGQFYLVCEYHGQNKWTASVAKWHGESGLRSSVPTELVASAPAVAV